ncbi:MAG: lytic transglycosylase domain-containing protein, partial [Jatrophihabitantaceae bacterium]
MRSSKAAADPPRHAFRPPRRVEPHLHITALAVFATAVTAAAAASPGLRGTFVGPNARARHVQSALVNDAQGTAGPVAQIRSGNIPLGPAAPVAARIPAGPASIPNVNHRPPADNGVAVAALRVAADGIPVTALEAYRKAANTINAVDPNCHLPWALLAGIGRVESDHGRFGGAVLRADGTSSTKIIGIPLNGNGTETVTDTDHGVLDGDPVNDRAVGPMQFIPSTWAVYATDGNGDGTADPFNIFDATAAAAHYLCVAGGDLSTTRGQTRAVLTYNHSTAYLHTVLSLERGYAGGDPSLIIPPAPVVVPPVPVQQPGGAPVPPPVDPGPPLAAGPPAPVVHHRKPTPPPPPR